MRNSRSVNLISVVCKLLETVGRFTRNLSVHGVIRHRKEGSCRGKSYFTKLSKFFKESINM